MGEPSEMWANAIREGYPIGLLGTGELVSVPSQAEVVVIGGGILGLLSALELRQAGLDVVVVEANRVGSAQSGRNLGFVRQQGRVSGEAPLLKRANDKWQQLSSVLGDALGLTAGGHVSLARTDAEGYDIESWGSVAREHDIDFMVFTGADISKRFPWLSSEFTTVGYTPNDAHIDPATAMKAIYDYVIAQGVKVVSGVLVHDLDITNRTVGGVQTSHGRIAAPKVVCAAGIWSARLLAQHGIQLPLHAGIGTVGLTKAVSRITEASVWEVGGLGLRQTRKGNVVFGLGAFVDVDVRWEDFAASLDLLPTLLKSWKTMRIKVGKDFYADAAGVLSGRGLKPFAWEEPKANERYLARGLQRLSEVVPALGGEFELETRWGGLIDSTPDFLPIVGDVGLPGLTVVTGMSGHGMGIAPAVAEAVVELVTEGRPTLDLSGLAPARFKRFREFTG